MFLVTKDWITRLYVPIANTAKSLFVIYLKVLVVTNHKPGRESKQENIFNRSPFSKRVPTISGTISLSTDALEIDTLHHQRDHHPKTTAHCPLR